MARELLPTLKMHLKEAEDLQDEIGGPVNPQNDPSTDTEPHQ
jgi:hypothetical protein